MNMATILELKNLRVEYRGQNTGQGKKVAVKDLNLTVQAGEVFGFLGPNGAGKTTTMNVLLGFVQRKGSPQWQINDSVGHVLRVAGFGQQFQILDATANGYVQLVRVNKPRKVASLPLAPHGFF